MYCDGRSLLRVGVQIIGIKRKSCLVEKEIGKGAEPYSHRYAGLNWLCCGLLRHLFIDNVGSSGNDKKTYIL